MGSRNECQSAGEEAGGVSAATRTIKQ
jgi:hypothetical protein